MTFEAFRQRVLTSTLPESTKVELITSFEREWVSVDQKMQNMIVFARNQAHEEMLQSAARHVMQLNALAREYSAATTPMRDLREIPVDRQTTKVGRAHRSGRVQS